jgi:PRC-barrel domain
LSEFRNETVHPRFQLDLTMVKANMEWCSMKHVVLAAVAAMLLVSPLNAQTMQPAKPEGGFVAQQTTDRLASRLIGLNIKNPADETIGEIYDIVLTDANAIRAYIVSVGGFLGIGTRYVAIDPKAISINRQDDKNWTATMKVNKDQLRAAPEYKWQSEWRKR